MSDGCNYIVCDVDGTLIPFGLERRLSDSCTARTVRAVRCAMDAGWRFSVVTGRRRPSAVKVHRQLQANGDLVCYQGSMVLDGETLEVLVHERIDSDIAATVIEYFMEEGLEVRVYVEDELFVFENGAGAVSEQHRPPSGRYELTSDPMRLAKLGAITIVGVDDPANMESRIATVSSMLGDRATVTHSLPHFCEVGPARAGKVTALEWLAEHRGLDRGRTVAFGDGLGDVEMLEWAKYGVAVGTDDPRVLAAADESVAGPESDGVADAIERLVAA